MSPGVQKKSGAKIVIAPGMDEALVRRMFSKSKPETFCSMCKILREDETTGFLDPTPAQIKVIRAIEANNWTFITKYRQAKVTTIVILHLLLRDCMYMQGIEGVLIADTNDTAEMAFRRIRFAYENLPPSVRMPLKDGRPGSKRELAFVHGGRIIIKSLESRSPAVGHSIDRLHITELGEAVHQKRAIVNLFPSINKRANAKLVIESTPGKAGTYHESMWHEALKARGRFFAVFLEWWHDKSCQLDPTGVEFDEDELAYMTKCAGMGFGALAFRQERLFSEFVGDTRLFGSKYPSAPLAGWLGSQRPRMPEDLIRGLLNDAVSDPDENDYGVGVIRAPEPGRKYELYADPCGFGATGDPAALTVFDLETLEEVAWWSGREDPDRLAVRIQIICEYYNNARAVVESNHAGCISALKMLHVKLYSFKRGHPGWWASDTSIARAEFALVFLLRASGMKIWSYKGLNQLRTYDGTFKRRATDEDGIGHHFDRARTYIMAASFLIKIYKKREKALEREAARQAAESAPQAQERDPGGIPFNVLNSGGRPRQGQNDYTRRPPKHR